MKEHLTFIPTIKILRSILLPVSFLMLAFIPSILQAQPDSAKKDAPAEEAPSSLIAPSLEFVSIQKADNTIDLKAVLKAKVKGTSYKLRLLKISFVLVTDTAEKALGFVITDANGKALLNAKAIALPTDKEGKLHLKALFAGNKQMDPAEAEVTIKRARLEIIPVKEDTSLSVKVKLIDIGTGTEIPVPNAVLGIFVKRLFNPLKLGEGTTDTTGEASVEIANHLPGDTKGNITLLARLDENELYGNVEASVTQKWGLPVTDKLQQLPRALWSPSPPIWMIVTFVILMAVVWGHFIVIILQLFRLRKEGAHNEMNTINPML